MCNVQIIAPVCMITCYVFDVFFVNKNMNNKHVIMQTGAIISKLRDELRRS